MSARLKKLGIVMAVLGLIFLAGGAFAYVQVQNGYSSLNKFSTAQNVKLTYDDQGHLVDHGSTESADAILKLLRDDWGFAVVNSDLDPNDPVLNTATEYMFEMATINHHVLSGPQTVVLDEDYTDDSGNTYLAGVEYTIVPEDYFAGGVDQTVHGYWSDYDRTNPVEAQLRGKVWSDTALALQGPLGVGAVTASTLNLALGVSAVIAGLGGSFILLGVGLLWAAAPAAAKEEKAPAKKAPAKK